MIIYVAGITDSNGMRLSVTPAYQQLVKGEGNSGSVGYQLLEGIGNGMVIFSQPGIYSVGVDFPAVSPVNGDSASTTITVTDTVYTSPPAPSNADSISLDNDQITLTPSVDSGTNLKMLARTTNTYTCFPTLMNTYSVSTNAGAITGLAVQFDRAISYSKDAIPYCSYILNPAVSYLFLSGYVSQMPDGVYPFSVSKGNAVYQGTITVSDDAYTFNWPYTSGVIISPLQVNRPQ